MPPSGTSSPLAQTVVSLRRGQKTDGSSVHTRSVSADRV